MSDEDDASVVSEDEDTISLLVKMTFSRRSTPHILGAIENWLSGGQNLAKVNDQAVILVLQRALKINHG